MSKPEMKLKTAEQGMINRVVSHFLAERKPTPRKKLIVEFREIEMLESLIQRSLLRDINREKYAPSLMSFYFCDDPEMPLWAKECLETVLVTLRELFLTSDDQTQFSTHDLETKARELGGTVDENTIWLGLYVAQEIGALGSYQWNADQTEITSVRVSEHIMRFNDIANIWDTTVEHRLNWLRASTPQFAAPSFSQGTETAELLAAEQSHPAASSDVLVFISHSSKDENIVLALVELLVASLHLAHDTIRCTSVDGYRLPAGANTDQVLKLEVRESRTFIGLITPDSMNSAYVLFELGARWGAGLHMIPVLAGVSPSALAGPLKGINCISATSDAQLHQLVHDVGNELKIAVQRPASYTKYINKLVHEIRPAFPNPDASSIESPSDSVKRSNSRKIDALTRELVISLASKFVWTKRLPKWTVMVEGREFPVRPLVLGAVGAFPNDSTTSNAATAKLKALGFEVRYLGERT
jgi:hypothetical protein